MAVNVSTSTIVDQAVSELELDPMRAFGDDSDLAVDIDAKYQGAVKFCLEAEDWSFASTIADLPRATPGDPPAEDPSLIYLYKLPDHCVKLREVLDLGFSWRADARFLLADQAGKRKIRYTRWIHNEEQMPDSFIDFVALRLAIKLAPRWLQSRAKRGDLYTMMKDAQADAKSADRVVSSGRRWDGGEMVSDWVSEALR